MKKLLALMIAVIMVMGLAGFALAFEVHHPAKKDRDGSISKNGKSIGTAYINSIVGEGATSDTNETTIYFADPSGTNKVIVPDSSGTFALTDDIASTMTLTDAKILVGASTGLAAEQTLSMINDVTGAFLNSGVLNATIPASTINSSMIEDTTIKAEDMNINTVTIDIVMGLQFNSVEVETGSTLMGWYISNSGAINGVTLFNTVEWNDPNAFVSINSTDATQDTTFELIFLRP